MESEITSIEALRRRIENLIKGSKNEVFELNNLTLNEIVDEVVIYSSKHYQQFVVSDRIFNHALDMLCIAGYDGYFKTLNPSWSKVLGWSTEEMLAKPWIEFTHPDDRKATENIKSAIVDGEEVYQFENRYICKDGTVKWLSWNSYPYPTENIMFGVARDITYKKQAEEKLFRSELKLKEKNKEYKALNEELLQTNNNLKQISNKLFLSELKLKQEIEESVAQNEELNQINEQLRSLTEELTESNLRTSALVAANPDLMFVYSRQGEFLDYHTPRPDLLLLKPENFLHKRVGDVLPEYLAKLNQEAIDKLFETGTAQNYSYTLVVNGTESHFDARMVKYGKDKALAIVRDITTQKQAEIAIAKSEEKFRLLVKNSSDTISILNAEGKQIYISPVVERVTGYKAEELLGTRIDEIIHPDDLQSVMEHWQELLLNPSKIQIANYRHIHKTQGWIYLEAVGQNFLAEPSVNGIVLSVRDINERKKAELELQASEEKYRLLFENMTQGFALHEIIVDENGKPCDYRYLSVNPAFEQLTGLNSSNLIGKTVLEVLPNIEVNWIETYGKVAQTKQAIRYENFSAELSKYFDVNAFSPKKGQFAVVFSDITMRKLAEEKVNKLSKGIEQSPAIVVITNTMGEIEYVNPRFTEVTGYSLKETVGQNPRILKSGHHNTEFYQNLWNTISSGSDWRGEILNKKKNGEEYWESALISPVKNEKGEIKNYIAIKEDITERKETLIALEQNNQLINAMLDNLPVGIFMVDSKTGKPLIANEHAKKLMGRGIIVDANVDSLAEVYKAYITGTNEPYPTSKMPIVQGINGVVSYVDDLEVEHPNGNRVLLEIFGSPLTDSAGNIWASLVGFHDITERKKEQEALKLSEFVLKEKNEEYLALNEELVESNNRISNINTELIAAREKAEENDMLKTAFLANMSHEIRTPMNAIIGFSEVLLKPTLSDEKQKFFTSVLNEACQQLLTVVNDVIDIAKVETKQVKLYKGEVDLNKLLQKSHSIYSAIAQKKGNQISLLCNLPDNDCTVIADETKLSQIVNNLLSNAIKFTTDGEIEMGYVEDNQFIKFYVKDSGIGISAENHSIVFERFRQVEVDDSRKFGGTGLGLSISKAFVELMGGQIWVESELGKGATFYFTIPYVLIKREKQIVNAIISEKFDFSGKIIILVEDEHANYLLINNWLEEANAKVIYAANGLEAVSLFENNPEINLVLMDIKMPEMNGFEATRIIKSIKKSIPVIALTAYAMAGDKAKCLEAGCDSYMSKPLKRQELLSLIASYFV